MTRKLKHVAVGTFDSAETARDVIHELRAAGISEDKIGLLTRDKDGDPAVKSFREMEGNKAGKGAAIGAATGASAGALWAAGVALGVLPAIGPVIAGGILAAVLASAAAGAGTGVVAGALIGMGVSDEEAAYHDEEFKKGRTIVIVESEDRGKVFEIMRRHASFGRYEQDTSGQLSQQVHT